ncbi:MULTISPECIES: ABC transporter substrate-binding protein [unclassified Bradyrhizobium]|uniref:ABC transporter substrate-binding protein n=1 Tax=unclassified Bradyrhizobium TaxID=2631580 RepID=UPI002916B266|nr:MULTISPECIES: ABC transporter substrate-binding protein [unclassified Bradyrhizobium]
MYFQPFAKAKGIRLNEDIYLGGWGQFRAMQESQNVAWDVVEVEPSELARGCEEGLFARLDWSRIGSRDKFLPQAVSDCGVGVFTASIVVAYNLRTIGERRPTSMTDFWDLNTWPGRRGLRRGPKFNMEFALLSDGVPPAEIYKTLRTEDGLLRVFRKIGSIKSSIIWWEAGAQPPELLMSGNVAMSLAYNARIATAIRDGRSLGMVWQPSMITLDYWAIMKRTPFPEAAYDLLAMLAQPERQADFARRFPYGPTYVEAASMLDADQRRELPQGSNIANALNLGSDEAIQFWLDRQDELTDRWNAWVARP